MRYSWNNRHCPFYQMTSIELQFLNFGLEQTMNGDSLQQFIYALCSSERFYMLTHAFTSYYCKETSSIFNIDDLIQCNVIELLLL